MAQQHEAPYPMIGPDTIQRTVNREKFFDLSPTAVISASPVRPRAREHNNRKTHLLRERARQRSLGADGVLWNILGIAF
jgi:hypothetical protein